MKTKSLLVVLLGLFFMFSCNNNDSNEILDATENNTVELISNTTKAKVADLPVDSGLDPGLYGPNSVDALKNATFSYIGNPNVLDIIPSNKRRFKISFYVKDNGEWKHQKTYSDYPHSTATAKFPKYGNKPKAKWKVIYSMYNVSLPFFTYPYNKKVTVYN